MMRHAKILTAWAVVAATVVGTASAASYLDADFSTYADGNLDGQNGWAQILAASSLPIQVAGGRVVIPFGQTTDNQDVAINLPSVVNSPVDMYEGLHLVMDQAPLIKTATNGSLYTSPAYFTAFYDQTDGLAFANFRLLAVQNDADPTTYFLESRVTGQSGSKFVAGTIPLHYGQQYNVIVQAHVSGDGNEVSSVFVNPTHADLSLETPYLAAPILTGTPSTSVGSFAISQFASRPSGTSTSYTGNAGFSLGSVRVADTALEASHWISGDVNFDGIANAQDIALISSSWLNSGTYLSGDANGDGVINAQDIALVSSNWLGTYSPPPGLSNASAVPEPSSIALAGLGAVALAFAARRRYAGR
jgi:hypothetical protein